MQEDKITLFQSRLLDSNGKLYLSRNVEVYFGEGSRLCISACDIGSFVKETTGDSDYEYWMTVHKDELNKLSLLLPVYNQDVYAGLLNTIKERFQDKDDCFELIRNLFDENGIQYKFEIWR